MELTLNVPAVWPVARRGDVELILRTPQALPAGARLWLLCDIRQDCSGFQTDDPGGEGFVQARDGEGRLLAAETDRARTLDLYPRVPEFLHAAEFRLEAGASCEVRIALSDWQGPLRPIEAFDFWLVVAPDASWQFRRTGYKSYRRFSDANGQRLSYEKLCERLVSARVRVEGRYPPVPAENTRRTPGVFWGELHGMAFNQRPLDDFYQYARDVTKLDFAAAMLFSYNICVQDMWRQVVEAAERNTREGQFIALAGFECGTPPDDSHRCAYFPDPRNVPPIFCETRPPAHDPHLHARFHPDTLRCETAEAFFRAVERYGGFVGGHFHTRTYRDERLAEIHQKQQPPVDEERRLFDLLRAGHRFGLVGGSDTHDSMPGNPHPEPGCPRPAGCTGVWAGELTVDSLCEAFRARRVFATSGARIAVRFDCGDAPMGSVLSASTLREFRIQVDAPHALARVELLHDGKTIHEWQPDSPRVDITHSPCPVSERRRESYLVRATQADGHRAWSSPIWFDQALRDT